MNSPTLDAEIDTLPTTRRTKRAPTHKQQPVHVTMSRKVNAPTRKNGRKSIRKSTRISKLKVRRL